MLQAMQRASVATDPNNPQVRVGCLGGHGHGHVSFTLENEDRGCFEMLLVMSEMRRQWGKLMIGLFGDI